MSPALVVILGLEAEPTAQLVCLRSSEEAELVDWLASRDSAAEAARIVQDAIDDAQKRIARWVPGDVLRTAA